MKLLRQAQGDAAPSRHFDQLHRWAPLRSARGVTLGGLGLVVCMLMLAIAMLAGARQAARHQRERAMSDIVAALERDVARPVGLIDLSLQGIAATMQLAEPGQAVPASRPLALFDQGTTAEILDIVVVLDAEGNVVASSGPLPAERPNLADRDYFRVQQQRHDVGPYVSQPYLSRLRNDARSVAISRRLTSPDGVFRGVVVAGLRLAYFEGIVSRLDLGTSGTASLVRTDGQLVLSHPARAGGLPPDLSGSDVLHSITRSGQSGQIVSRSRMDGVERLHTYRQVGNLPLLLVVGTSFEDIDAAWWRKTQVVGSILLVLCGAVAVLSVLGRRRVFWRVAAEASLLDAVEQQGGSSTDALTGLAERLRFSALLREAWQHAARDSAPLALLVVDVDFIEAFNDRYGSSAGDEVLTRVGACIKDVILPEADVGARLGSDELAVLLPDTDADGAATLAELLRASVDGLGIEHAASPKAKVTVSIGWASCLPERGQDPELLLAGAERALCVAKREGRNRVAGVLAGSRDVLHSAA
jgi:diguanylate cyclase (GGDEF)-like protein